VKLDRTLNVHDVRELARRHLPRTVFDLIDGGAEDEATMLANEAAFASIEFRPRTLETTVAGMPVAAPLVLARRPAHGSYTQKRSAPSPALLVDGIFPMS
jgi:(S)-mandelate dehydrogenase